MAKPAFNPPADRIAIQDARWNESDPEDRLQGLVHWVNHVLINGHYPPEALPPEALQGFYVEIFRQLVTSGKLSWFVSESQWKPETIAYVRAGLRAMGRMSTPRSSHTGKSRSRCWDRSCGVS